MPTRKKTATTITEKKMPKKTGIVQGGRLNLRKEADIHSESLGLLDDGATVTILEDCGEWLRIDGGYVMSKWVKK